MKVTLKGLALFVALVGLAVASTEVVVLWNQVGRLQAEQTSLQVEQKSLRSRLRAYEQRELQAKQIDTSPKRDEWLLSNKNRGLKPPPQFASGFKKFLWEGSYSPRKGEMYDVAYVEWRLSGRRRGEGENQTVELLWVTSVVNSSKSSGYNLELNLEFLDERGFRLATADTTGYIFPIRPEDDSLPHETKLKGALWIPHKLAREIREVTGTWRARPDF